MNRVWMITGAGRGLGHAFAEEAVKNGDKVIATIRKINDTDPLMKNENVLPVIMDVTKKEEVAAAVDAGIKKFGRIDVLINNAGFGMSGAFEEVSDEELRTLMDGGSFGSAQHGTGSIWNPGRFHPARFLPDGFQRQQLHETCKNFAGSL